jgi:hypothetical protein
MTGRPRPMMAPFGLMATGDGTEAVMLTFRATGKGQGQAVCGPAARGNMAAVVTGGIKAAGDNRFAVGSGQFKI